MPPADEINKAAPGLTGRWNDFSVYSTSKELRMK